MTTDIERWTDEFQGEIDRLKAEVETLRDQLARAKWERDAYLRMLTPESSGGLWYAVTGHMDPFVTGWSSMELDGPWHDRADAVAAVRKPAGLDAVPADERREVDDER